MPKFGTTSKSKLEKVHPILRDICNRVVDEMDISIVYGYRDQEEQNKLFEKGASKLKFPKSAHNREPYSFAVDAIPYPQLWTASKEEFSRMRELFVKHASNVGAEIEPLIIFKDGNGDWAHVELKLAS